MAAEQAKKHVPDNLVIWNKVKRTNPDFTEKFSRSGGFRGTAINPTYMAFKATEVFGPIGKGWGVDIQDETLLEGAPIVNGDGQTIGREVIHKLRVCLWYFMDDQRCEVVQFGQTTFVGRNKYGLFTDEEAPKKSLTDATTKCLSLLGFSADVHMGRYDDSKYVNDLRQELNEARRQGREQRQAPEQPDKTPRKPPAKPQVSVIDVPRDENGPDWTAFSSALIVEIDKAPDLATLNALLKAHNPSIAEVKAKAPKVYEYLAAATGKRRSALGQAPLPPKGEERGSKE